MDVRKLTQNEIVESLAETGVDIYDLATQTFKTIEQGKIYPTPIADLYIAQILSKTGIQIPVGYNITKLPADVFVQLAETYYLPKEDTPGNRTRAARITRIILDLAHSQNDQLKIQICPTVPKQRLLLYLDMIDKPEFKDSLFIFYDMLENFLAFHEFIRNGNKRELACDPSPMSNAYLRPLQCQNPPRAASIPHIHDDKINNIISVKPYIDIAIQYIKDLLVTGRYNRVCYPVIQTGYLLNPNKREIYDYIVESIENLVK